MLYTETTKNNVLEYLKSKGYYYNSLHIIDSQDGSNEPIEVYINNYRVLSISIHRPISTEEVELFMPSIGDFWNYSAKDKAAFFRYYPYCEKKMPKLN